MKLNRKGFTLFELLAVIIILAIITGITVVTVLGVLNKSKEKSLELTYKNIIDQAEKYISEGYSGKNWHYVNDTIEYKCVTVKELIEVGYFKPSILTDNEGLNENDVVKIARNSKTLAIISKGMAKGDVDCNTGSSTSTISCEFAEGWAQEKEVTYTFTNSEHYKKRLYLNRLNFDYVEGYNLQWYSGNYYEPNPDNNIIKIKAKSNETTIAKTVLNGKVMSTLHCNITGIDRNPPEIKFTSDGRNLTCSIKDNESGTVGYKICKECESTNYTEISPTQEEITRTKDNADNGTWYCYGIDRVGNSDYKSIVINIEDNVDIGVSLIAKKIDSSGSEIGDYVSGNWTKNNVKLIGKINKTPANTQTQCVIDNSINHPNSGWENCNTEYIKKITPANNTITNEKYYLHVRYLSGGDYKYVASTPFINVKIDKVNPTCKSNITENNSSNGISATIGCEDEGSGCQTGTTSYTEQTSNFSKIIKDNVGNEKECKIDVTLVAKKKYCKNENYNERCITVINPSNKKPTNDQLKNMVACKNNNDSKQIASKQFRYYIRQSKDKWYTSSHNGNLKEYDYKLCYSNLSATWITVLHTNPSDYGLYFWYATNLGSGNGDSPLQRAIKGLVVCGTKPEDGYYQNLATENANSLPNGYFTERYKSVDASNFPSTGNNRVQHRGYYCQYEEEVSNHACPEGVTKLNQLAIPQKDGKYYMEVDNATYDSGPNNWNGESWFSCVGKYVGTIVN